MPAAVAALAFVLYACSAAPTLTWAHEGADGGELVAAAIVNGVPHPPGYPLYIPLLQAWLALLGLFLPNSEPIWRAALLSALCGALSVGVTAVTALHLVRRWPHGWLWATAAALAWAISPLLWSQVVIAEVYALHALLFTLLGWAVLVHPRRLWALVVLVALGAAHHLTFLLLLPAAWYGLWAQRPPQVAGRRWLLQITGVFALGLALGALVYLRIALAAGQGPPPVNWGYADNWSGFWWLVSGAAYRGYLLGSGAASMLSRVAAWAYTLTVQYTPLGLALALVGLAQWDRETPWLRNLSLLWLTPVSIYALIYYTRDSEIYLLPVVWLMALWLAVGLSVCLTVAAAWLARKIQRQPAPVLAVLGGVLALSLAGLAIWRWPQASLAGDREARSFLDRATAQLPPNSIVVTLADKETFAFWYGVWGDSRLTAAAPGLIPINESLYQFDWYRRLQRDLHPEIAGIGESVEAVIAGNRGVRPIFFAQQPTSLPEDAFEAAGPLWKVR